MINDITDKDIAELNDEDLRELIGKLCEATLNKNNIDPICVTYGGNQDEPDGGVDVRIITPHIPDKKMVFMVTRSYYAELIKAGVKIYEYTPGFIHGKTIVSDDTLGIVGSANFDFRSLYLHYEISCLLYDASTIIDIKNDFLKTAESSHEVLLSETKTKNIFKKILVAILRAFSPMM